MNEIKVYKLFSFYKKELRDISMVFSKSKSLKRLYYLINLSPIILPIISFFVVYFIDKIIPEISDLYMLIIFIILLILPLMLLLYLFNKEAKKITLKEYNIKSDEILWNDSKTYSKIHEAKIDKLLCELKKNYNISKSSDIKAIIELTEFNASKIKYKIPIETLSFIAFLLPLWASFINWSFDKILTFNKALMFVFIMVFTIFIIYFISILVSTVTHLVVDEIFNRDYNKMNELTELLYDAYTEVNNKEESEIHI